jgi:cell division protein FtsL
VTRGEEMEEIIKYTKNKQPALILVLILLCLILIGGVTYDTVLLTQTKTQAAQADKYAQHDYYDIRTTDQDVQKNGVVLSGLCSYNDNSDPTCDTTLNEGF